MKLVKQKITCLFLVLFGCCSAVYKDYHYAKVIKVLQKKEPESPRPYEFSYSIQDEHGNSQGRQESGDAQGNKRGYYQIQSIDGLKRWVEYVADENGFRATIRTNEPGTSNENPADVNVIVDETPNIIHAPRTQRPTEAPTEPPTEPPTEAPRRRGYKIIKIPIHRYKSYFY